MGTVAAVRGDRALCSEGVAGVSTARLAEDVLGVDRSALGSCCAGEAAAAATAPLLCGHGITCRGLVSSDRVASQRGHDDGEERCSSWKGKLDSSNVTWRDVITRRVARLKHLYPLWSTS